MFIFFQSRLFFLTALCLLLSVFIILCSSKTLFAKTTSINSLAMNNLWKRTITVNNQQLAEQYPYQQCFKQASKKQQVPVEILLALAKGESNFDANAKSKSNAYGVMQILWPSTANHLGITTLKNLLKPCTNIKAGAKYLKELLSRYNNNLHLAMAAYNYGPGRIKLSMTKFGMPNGAIWYSHYIYQHYQTIINRLESNNQLFASKKTTWKYQPNNQMVILTFNQAYRAQGFTDYLKQLYPFLKIEWFKTPLTMYHVVLRYDNKKEFNQSKKILAKQGFKT